MLFTIAYSLLEPLPSASFLTLELKKKIVSKRSFTMDQSFFTGRISQLGTRVEPEQSKRSESKDETHQNHQYHSGDGQDGPAGMATHSFFSRSFF